MSPALRSRRSWRQASRAMLHDATSRPPSRRSMRPQRDGEVFVVGDQHQRGAGFGVEVEQQFDDRLAGVGVEVAGRLVGEQQRRPRHERARQCHALLFAAGQLARVVAEALRRARPSPGSPAPATRRRGRRAVPAAASRSPARSATAAAGSSGTRSRPSRRARAHGRPRRATTSARRRAPRCRVLGVSRPAISASRVLLPEPEAPTIATVSPRPIAKPTPSRMVSSPDGSGTRLPRPRTSRAMAAAPLATGQGRLAAVRLVRTRHRPYSSCATFIGCCPRMRSALRHTADSENCMKSRYAAPRAGLQCDRWLVGLRLQAAPRLPRTTHRGCWRSPCWRPPCWRRRNRARPSHRKPARAAAHRAGDGRFAVGRVRAGAVARLGRADRRTHRAQQAGLARGQRQHQRRNHRRRRRAHGARGRAAPPGGGGDRTGRQRRPARPAAAADAHQPRAHDRRGAGCAAPRCCWSACACRRTTAPPTPRSSSAATATLAQRFDTALLPFLLEPIAADRGAFQADNLHPVASAQPKLRDHVWPALEPLLK